jgi:hypothetical protein
VAFILSHAPDRIPLSQPQLIDLDWWGDASTSFGIGTTIGSFWAVWTWAPNFKVGPHQGFDIGWAKTMAVELGLRFKALHSPTIPCGFLVYSFHSCPFPGVLGKSWFIPTLFPEQGGVGMGGEKRGGESI